MREYCTEVLKNLFSTNLLQSRSNRNISQEEMAHRLRMASRSYVELEHGKSCCSAVTLMLYLCYFCADPLGFLASFRTALDAHNEAA